MTITTEDLATRVADTLVENLPTTKALTPATRITSAPTGIDVSAAVVATFVGATSYDLAIALADENTLAPAAGEATVSLTDLVHNAVVEASSVLGDGVVSGQAIDDASALFADPKTHVFELHDGSTLAGLFGIRARAASVGAGSGDGSVTGRLGRINNVEMALTVEIGRTRMSVRDVLNLEPGAVVELDRSAGAPADILLNGRLVAFGEVVVVDQDYAVRVTQILDTPDIVA